MSGGGPAVLPSENRAVTDLRNSTNSEEFPLYTVHSRHGTGVWRLRLSYFIYFVLYSTGFYTPCFNGLHQRRAQMLSMPLRQSNGPRLLSIISV